MWKSGDYTMLEIAAKLDCTRNAVSGVLNRAGIFKGKHRGAYKPSLTKKRNAAIPDRWTDEVLTQPWKDRHAHR